MVVGIESKRSDHQHLLSNVPNYPRTTARRESESSKIELMDIVASLSAA